MNAAALRDLEKIEAYHYRRERECRDANQHEMAERHLAQAQTVRGCIVTVQAAEAREPDRES